MGVAGEGGGPKSGDEAPPQGSGGELVGQWSWLGERLREVGADGGAGALEPGQIAPEHADPRVVSYVLRELMEPGPLGVGVGGVVLSGSAGQLGLVVAGGADQTVAGRPVVVDGHVVHGSPHSQVSA